MSESYPYIYRGTVVDNEDPDDTGRCKINVPSLYGTTLITKDMIPWARIMTTGPYNDDRASIMIPDKGDIVWVFFEGGNKNFPVYIGGVVGTKDIPVDIDEVVFYKEGDNSLIYKRESEDYTIIIGEHQITLKRKENMKILSELGIDIESDETVTIKGKNIKLEADERIDLEAQEIKLKADTINIEADTLELKSSTSKVESDSMTIKSSSIQGTIGTANLIGDLNIVGVITMDGQVVMVV